jgi:hypothetical protein
MAWGWHTAMLGGYRDGLALGARVESRLTDRWEGRFGFEGSTGQDLYLTGDNPFILFGTLNYYLGSLRQAKVSLCSGLTAYTGDSSMAGVSFSLLFDHALENNDSIFVELGTDIMNGKPYLNAQVGYAVLSTDTF